jgi:glycosyltransferase involved in cell wall biosynthesis
MADVRDVSIVIPALNEAAAVAGVVADLRAAGPWREILVVDDGSTDDTGARAAAAGARVIRHPYRKGNGAAVKSGIRQATGGYVLIIDADGQHQPADAVRLCTRLGEYDLVVGARAGDTHATITRRLGNTLLNRLASFLTERAIPDLTSGFRAARREHLLEFLHLLPNGFSTPTTTTLAFLRAGYNVTFEPVDARMRRQESSDSKIRLSKDGPKFLLIVLRVMTIFSPFRVFLPVSGLSLAAGVVYGAGTIWFSGKIANGAVILIMFAVVVFLVGLVSEQISALRFDGRK